MEEIYNWEQREYEKEQWKKALRREALPTDNQVPIEILRQMGQAIPVQKSFEEQVFEDLYSATSIKPIENVTHSYLTAANEFPTLRQVLCSIEIP